MRPQSQLKQLLESTFTDRVIDTDEKSTLFTEFQHLSRSERAYVRNRAFDMVRTAQQTEAVPPLLQWLQAVIKSLDNSLPDIAKSDTYFSPGDACLNALISAIKQAKNSLDICVFTISDNTIRDALLQAHRRNVDIRIITDDEKTQDLGSDIETLSTSGIKTRIDKTRHHMHHKFAIFDQKRLFTGSFNWTRSASLYNHENLVLLEDTEAISSFSNEFEELWQKFSPFRVA